MLESWRRATCVALLALALGTAGCGLPRDPEGTLERVRAGTLRAGISARPPWAVLERGQAAGLEVELVEAFARHLAARVVWSAGAESELLERLERGELDVVVAGLTRGTPWAERVALSQPHARAADGEHVLATRRGENGWLLALDAFVLEGAP